MLKSESLQLEMFKGFSQKELDDLKTIIECRQYNAGEMILRQNERADYLYIVVNGNVEILHVPYDGPQLSVGKLSSGVCLAGPPFWAGGYTPLPSSLYRIAPFIAYWAINYNGFANSITRQAWYYWKR